MPLQAAVIVMDKSTDVIDAIARCVTLPHHAVATLHQHHLSSACFSIRYFMSFASCHLQAVVLLQARVVRAVHSVPRGQRLVSISPLSSCSSVSFRVAACQI
jgi:hypothetical protein